MGKFQNVFKSLRIREGLTQEELAAKLGVTRSTIGNWEQGTREPDFETAELIADYFNVDMNILTGNKTDEDYYNDVEIKQLAQSLHDNQELRLLLYAAKLIPKEKLIAITELINKLKED